MLLALTQQENQNSFNLMRPYKRAKTSYSVDILMEF